MQKKLPIGIENFEDMIKENYYYVDKTGLIKQLLRTRRNTTAILDQYKRKLYRKTIYRKSKSADKKRN